MTPSTFNAQGASRDYHAEWVAGRRFASRCVWAAIATFLFGVFAILLLPMDTPIVPFGYTWIVEFAGVVLLAAGALALRCPACGARFAMTHTFRDLDRMTRCPRCGVNLSLPVLGTARPSA